MTKITIGATVILARHFRDTEDTLTLGQKGVVSELMDDTVGVRWEGLTVGHGGNDYLSEDRDCWYVSPDALEVVVKSKDLQPMTQQVLEHLVTVGTISAIEAIGMYKVRSLTKQISMIRDAGYPVTSEWKRDVTGQRYKRYYLSTQAVAA